MNKQVSRRSFLKSGAGTGPLIISISATPQILATDTASVIDCGLAVNPLGVRAQVESGIHDGLSAAKYGNYRFEAGVPVTNNFDTYQKMRIDEAPP